MVRRKPLPTGIPRLQAGEDVNQLIGRFVDLSKIDILPRLKSGDSQRRQSCDCVPERVPASTRLPRGTRLGFRRKHSHVGNFTGTNQPPTPPGLTISPQADTACPAAVSPVSTLKAKIPVKVRLISSP